MTKQEVLNKLRKDLRALSRNNVLFEDYPFNDGTMLLIKCTKQSIMAIALCNADGVIYRGPSIWDQTQKQIIAKVEDFLSEVPND